MFSKLKKDFKLFPEGVWGSLIFKIFTFKKSDFTGIFVFTSDSQTLTLSIIQYSISIIQGYFQIMGKCNCSFKTFRQAKTFQIVRKKWEAIINSSKCRLLYAETFQVLAFLRTFPSRILFFEKRSFYHNDLSLTLLMYNFLLHFIWCGNIYAISYLQWGILKANTRT